MSRTPWLAILAATAVATTTRADEDVSTNAPLPHADHGNFMVSPLAGFDRNEYSSSNPYTHQTEVHKDTGGDYGIMGSYVSSQFSVNNILFYTDPNNSKVWGDILSLSASGDPKADVTWALGACYTWHEIEMPGMALRINEPLLRAGPLFRVPAWNLAINPYVGYARLSVDTTYGDDAWDTSVYGVIARWDWRMLHATGQYYLQDAPALDQVFQVFRARLTAFVTENLGFMIRGEYMRQYSSKDTSLLMGPVYLF